VKTNSACRPGAGKREKKGRRGGKEPVTIASFFAAYSGDKLSGANTPGAGGGKERREGGARPNASPIVEARRWKTYPTASCRVGKEKGRGGAK